jgi:bifunctional UDP-N-acetylglucosamine pyrophosphorylase/glucosamine-1-phosphate N-acetyltransferase
MPESHAAPKPPPSSDVHLVILAAGKGTRMKSARPKVLHRVAGAPMIDYVLRTAATLAPRSITVVIGHQADDLKTALARYSGLRTVVQEPQLGTGHALRITEPLFDGTKGTLVLLSGDVPLLSAKSLKDLVVRHSTTGAAATVITSVVANPHGYGRIVRTGDAGAPEGEQIARIVEERDATDAERQIREINSGIYAFSVEGLFDALRELKSDNAQREYYLPDLVARFRAQGRGVQTMVVGNPNEIQGINSRSELAAVSRIVRQRKNEELMAAGVTIQDPATTYIDESVTVGPDTVIHPGVTLQGTTAIGEGCEIYGGARISNSRLADRVTVLDHCVIADTSIGSGATIGPFAHLRNEAQVGARTKVGNFVEMKRTTFGEGSKAMHLSYLGDAVIGENVNIGAGTITCNYDGTHKHTTTIEKGAFIGSDTQLIAPVTVGADAYVGTGTTVREPVPPGALAVSAGKQRNIEGWVEQKKKRR